MYKPKIKSALSKSAIIVSMISSVQSSEIGQDSGLVGPGYYSKDKSEVVKIISVIKEKYAPYLETNVSPDQLDQFFCAPSVTATGWVKDVLGQFTNKNKPTQKEKEIALGNMPKDKILAIHIFENKETVEGAPLTQTVNVTYAAQELTKHEQMIKITGTKCGFDFSFMTTIDLTGKEEPKTSFIETPVEKSIENQVTEVPSGGQEKKEKPTFVSVAIYSDKADIPSQESKHVALRQKHIIK